MSRISERFAIAGGVSVVLLAYLLAWPVPVDPVSWSAPADAGLIDPFEANDHLRHSQPLDLRDHAGPEDIAAPGDGFLYVSSAAGSIVRLRPDGSEFSVFAETGGRPLGIEFDGSGNLFVANPYIGLQRISPQGDVELLASEYDGQQLVYVNDVAVARDGTVYFSDSSRKFGAREFGGTYAASLLDIVEHGGHGRLFSFDPQSAVVRLLMDGLNFANGVAISDDQDYLVVSETGHYRIWRYWLVGEKAGTGEVILQNLPGFPDNINNGMQGRFWIGLVAPRVPMLDNMSDKPFMRQIAQRLPQFL